MYLLYTDESEIFPDGGKVPRYFALVGVSVFERQTHWISVELEKIAARFNPGESRSIELHGSPMFGGGGFWRTQPKETRIQAIKDVLHVLANSHRSNRIFASVVERDAVADHPMDYAFEQLATRFDYYLGRNGFSHKHPQRGMVLFDKSAHEKTIQSATAVYRDKGHQWGRLKYFAEVPAFIDSRSSRLIQLADIVAYAINRKIARNDEQFYKIIESRFDSADGKIHGLHIKRAQGGVDSF